MCYLSNIQVDHFIVDVLNIHLIRIYTRIKSQALFKNIRLKKMKIIILGFRL